MFTWLELLLSPLQLFAAYQYSHTFFVRIISRFFITAYTGNGITDLLISCLMNLVFAQLDRATGACLNIPFRLVCSHVIILLLTTLTLEPFGDCPSLWHSCSHIEVQQV